MRNEYLYFLFRLHHNVVRHNYTVLDTVNSFYIEKKTNNNMTTVGKKKKLKLGYNNYNESIKVKGAFTDFYRFT